MGGKGCGVGGVGKFNGDGWVKDEVGIVVGKCNVETGVREWKCIGVVLEV